MRGQVEPLLQELLGAYFCKINVGHTCSLGTVPIQLEDIKTTKCTEVTPDHEQIENLHICGRLDYSGDSAIEVKVKDATETLPGSMMLTNLTIKGDITFELIGFTSE